jgi:polysaccharide biosynthesis/export protein
MINTYLKKYRSLCMASLMPILAFAISCASQAAAQGVGNYLLGPGDFVEVALVAQQSEVTKTRINNDNSVVLPLIGRIIIGGYSINDAQTRIEQGYLERKFIVNPIVRIDVISYESQKVSVLGQVNSQTLVALDRQYSTTEILARAGGLTGEAGDSIIIVRHVPGGASVREEFDLVSILSGTSASPILRSGDVVFVPRAPTVSVVGAVARAGSFKFSRGATVQQAIALAGDVTRLGSLDGLRIRRRGTDGSKIVSVSLDDMVLDGDVIMIKERLF